jgi:cbb3-type cytochrome oxidase subunit 3
MDINTLRIAITIVALATFVGITVWAYLPSRKHALDEQGRRLLEDSEP